MDMQLKIFLPSRLFIEKNGVTRIVAESPEGWFGLLPRRLDCVAALTPGILIYETGMDGEAAVAIDAGVLVKTGGALEKMAPEHPALVSTGMNRMDGDKGDKEGPFFRDRSFIPGVPGSPVPRLPRSPAG